MRRFVILLAAIAAALPPAGCTTLVDASKEKCEGVYPKVSPAYDDCWHREFDRQMELQNEYLDELSRAASHTNIGR
jgi:hypothetical protein